MKNLTVQKQKILLLVMLLGLALPIAIYTAIFGPTLSGEHSHWGEFGDFLGGVYATIAAFLTLALIAGQISSQNHFNKHQIDQDFLSNSRADLHFYMEQLESILLKNEKISSAPLNHSLIAMFGSKTHEQLKGPIFAKDVKRIGMTDTRISGIWSAIYAIFSGLKAAEGVNYELVYVSSRQKCIAIFGYALCDALDNYHFVACQYPPEFPYEFYLPPGAEI